MVVPKSTGGALAVLLSLPAPSPYCSLQPMFQTLVFSIALLASFGCVRLAYSDVEPSSYAVKLRRADDAWDVTADGKQAIFSIQSPTGISDVMIERREEHWPARVVVRLHLKGLESFSADNGKLSLRASIPSTGGKLESHQARQDAGAAKGPAAEPTEIKPGDPDWMDIQLYKHGGEPATGIPVEKGYFEIVLPERFLQENPKSVRLEWIDFYR